MKQQILEKIFNDEILTNEECLFISQNLCDNSKPLSYNHEESNPLTACNINDDDCDKVNKMLVEIFENKSNSRISEIIEKLEKITLTDKYKRVLLLQFYSDAVQKHDNPFEQIIKAIIKKRKEKDDEG